ncbi:MAG: sulfotransferase domain-containing protein [Acidobacteriota bacterium]|nr:sulfotransferase domain-containing protein [Acidobacteriota bacterium]
MKLPGPIRKTLKKAVTAYHRCLLRRRPPTTIILAAHMRSGSTLLAHLLMSHPQILGAGERNKIYRTVEDFTDLALDIYRENRLIRGQPMYVMDQVNHTRFLPEPELLNRPEVKLVMLVRRPEPTVQSMVRTFQPIYGDWPQDRAIAAYEERLQALIDYAEILNRDWFFTTYDELVNDTNRVLEDLTRFLDLSTPLSEEYRTWPFTGRRGDPSPNIQAGKILRRQEEAEPLPPEIAARLTGLYRSSVNKRPHR